MNFPRSASASAGVVVKSKAPALQQVLFTSENACF